MDGYAHADKTRSSTSAAKRSVANASGPFQFHNAIDRSPRAQSLAQLRRVLDRSPRVQAQQALQQVLNPPMPSRAAERCIVQRTISRSDLNNQVVLFNDPAATETYLTQYIPRRYERLVMELQALHPQQNRQALIVRIVNALRVMIQSQTPYEIERGDWDKLKLFLDGLRTQLGLGEEAMPIELLAAPQGSASAQGSDNADRIDLDVAKVETAPFWQQFEKQPGKDLLSIRNLLVDLDTKWRKGTASVWERALLSQSAEQLAQAADYRYFKGIGALQAEAVANILNGPGDDIEDAPVVATKNGVRDILAVLDAYAKEQLKQVRSKASDDENVDVSANSVRGKILTRAINDIMQNYGAKMLYATAFAEHDMSAYDNLRNARLRHSSVPWRTATPDEKDAAATKALYYTMSTEASVQQVLERLQTDHYKNSTIGNVLQAYAQQILSIRATADVKATLMMLAELRLRWGPITYGHNIYIEAGSRPFGIDDQWNFYMPIIHEALHAAEHPGFERFLHRALPENMISDVKEGIVEFLTRGIWRKVIAKVQVQGDGVAAAGPSSGSASLATTQNRIDAIKDPKGYDRQVAMVQAIVNLLDSGQQRLEAAYFYGNVEAFLPDLMAMAAEDENDDSQDDDENVGMDVRDVSRTKNPKDEKQARK